MNISIPFSSVLNLERLDFDLQIHAYAFHLLTEDDDPEGADVRSCLLFDRAAALEETVQALHSLVIDLSAT